MGGIRCGFKLNTIEEGLVKRLIRMAMYLVITICAIIGWGSITSGPAYMQLRVIITIIAAITFYLLFSSDLTLIFNKLFAQIIEGKKQIAPASQETALPPAQYSGDVFWVPSVKYSRDGAATERYGANDNIAR
jgi:hypothetical protein